MRSQLNKRMFRIYLIYVIIFLIFCNDKSIDTTSDDLPIIIEKLPVNRDDYPSATTTGFIGAGYTLDDLTYVDNSDASNYPAVSIYSNKVVINGENLGSSHPLVTSGNVILEDTLVILQKLDILGGIYIASGSPKVIIRYNRVQRGLYGINCLEGCGEVLIEYTEVTNADVVEKQYNEYGERKGILARNATIRFCDVNKYADGIYLSNNVIIEDSYIHDLYLYHPTWDDPDSKEDGTHSDGIQSSGGINYIVRNNFIDARNGRNSAMIFQTNYGNLNNILIENNYLLGGSYTVYLNKRTENGTYTLNDVTIKKNYFYHEDKRRIFGSNLGTPQTYIENRLSSGELASFNN